MGDAVNLDGVTAAEGGGELAHPVRDLGEEHADDLLEQLAVAPGALERDLLGKRRRRVRHAGPGGSRRGRSRGGARGRRLGARPPGRLGPRRAGGCPGNELIDGIEQILEVDRLRHVAVEAGLEAPLAIAAHRVGGDGHERKMLARGPLVRADGGRRLEAVHLRHLHVHEHHVEAFLRERIERRPAAADHRRHVAGLLEQAQHQLLVDHIVLGEQEAQRTAGDGRGAPIGHPALLLADEPGAERSDDCRQQVTAPDRLRQERGDAQLAVVRAGGSAPGGGEHHDQGGTRSALLQGMAQREAVHIGHPGVDQDEVERGAGPVGRSHRRERRIGAVHDDGVEAPAEQKLAEDAAARPVVVHDQDPSPLDRARDRGLGLLLGARDEAGDEVEGAPRPDLAVDPQTAVHELDQARRDREAEAGPLVLAGGRPVGLREGLEDDPLLVLLDTHPRVAHLEVQLEVGPLRLVDLDRHEHLSLVGELDGVTHQVEQDLAEAKRVAAQALGDAGRDPVSELQPLLVGT